MIESFTRYINTYEKAAPLAVFRVLFGLMMLASIVRFWANGWIEKLYLEPSFFFSYYGFEFVKPMADDTYWVFIICGASALFVALGFMYRFSIILFFLSFTYIELMDKTTYLNHYYFISLMSFIMIWLPANGVFSIDSLLWKRLYRPQIPRYLIDVIKFMLGIVYFYAGLAKLNSDWLFKAMPLKIWLPSKYDIPFLGELFQYEWMHYGMSWGGAIFDLTIPFLLLYKRTRSLAFAAVVGFHVITRILFPIGMFPFIMIGSVLIFVSAELHQQIINWCSNLFKFSSNSISTFKFRGSLPQYRQRIVLIIFSVFFVIQLLLPFRYVLYPGELFWTEEGYRFSWRVMLMEKAGYATFSVENPETGKRFEVVNSHFLSSFQEKQMSTQPDFIVEYAHYLAKYYQQKGQDLPAVYVDSYVALNGRPSKRYIDPSVNLTHIEPSFRHKTWILPFGDEIKGL